jgi:hypothetical protein
MNEETYVFFSKDVIKNINRIEFPGSNGTKFLDETFVPLYDTKNNIVGNMKISRNVLIYNKQPDITTSLVQNFNTIILDNELTLYAFVWENNSSGIPVFKPGQLFESTPIYTNNNITPIKKVILNAIDNDTRILTIIR